ncbi:MAG TPA: HlyD family type I secretion periplasmic adaptor subunit [Paracoccaceae bacterium]|nr:HlyD family type I secretion periplasmic adaptor subunit [Paracoccaceae bacterium]
MTGPLSIRGALATGLVTLTLLLLAFGGWGATARLSGAVIAPGRVEVQGSPQIVQHPEGGVVADVLVTEGQTVTAGQPVLRLDGGDLRSEQAILRGSLLALMARRARLEAEQDGAPAIAFPRALDPPPDAQAALLVAGQTRLFRARAEARAREADLLDRRAAQVQAQIAGIAAEAAALTRERVLIRADLADQTTLLNRGHALAARVRALARDVAQVDGRLAALDASRAAAEARLTEIAAEALRLQAALREEVSAELRDIAPEESALAERDRALGARIDRLTLGAPAAGRVLGLAVTTPGAVIRPAETLAHVVPDGRPLVVIARLRPEDVDAVRPGTRATLVATALPAAARDDLAGTVTLLSADALADPAGGPPFFRAVITPDAPAPGLLPGMPVEVFLRTTDRSPLAWLVAPFTAYFARALRESG